jgi:hypothetical protein
MTKPILPAMLGRHIFEEGMRVRPSAEGRKAYIFEGKRYAGAEGTVVKVDHFNAPTVLWDSRTTASRYHPDFIEPATDD